MSSKKKVLISVCAFAFVLILAVSVIATVIASSIQGVSSHFSVVYYLDSVDCEMSARYFLSQSSNAISLTTSDGEEVIVYESRQITNKNVDTKSFQLNNLEFNSDSDSVVFEFEFTNISTTDSMLVVLSDACQIENLTCNYCSSSSKIEDFSLIDDDEFESAVVDKGDTLFVYIKYTLIDPLFMGTIELNNQSGINWQLKTNIQED